MDWAKIQSFDGVDDRKIYKLSCETTNSNTGTSFAVVATNLGPYAMAESFRQRKCEDHFLTSDFLHDLFTITAEILARSLSISLSISGMDT